MSIYKKIDSYRGEHNALRTVANEYRIYKLDCKYATTGTLIETVNIEQVTNLGFIQTTDVSGDTVDCFAFPVTILCQIMKIINICTICIES